MITLAATSDTWLEWLRARTPGDYIERFIDWFTTAIGPVLSAINDGLSWSVDRLETLLLLPPAWAMAGGLTVLAWAVAGRGTAVMSLLGFLVILWTGLWAATMQTLTLVLVAAAIALVIGVPVGVAAARREWLERGIRPLLDFMQTMPAFVYLIPAVLFFSLGEVPGVMATVIFAMPPAVRLTTLGIRQVSKDVLDAAWAFGCTPHQALLKVQLPLALPTILAGVNQTIMLALSMVVIAAMIGAGGLGGEVLKGITQLQIDLGFDSGIAVVILAIFLDRITQALGAQRRRAQSAD
ncbi:MAG: ABC transporter permease [bacterium]